MTNNHTIAMRLRLLT